MEKLTIMVSIIGIIGTLSSIFFAYLACKKTNMQEQKVDGKTEGAMLSDIGYIKACVDRVEKNLSKVDERYRNIAERLAKVEEAVANVTKRVDEL
jgi:archaellum component FlaC